MAKRSNEALSELPETSELLSVGTYASELYPGTRLNLKAELQKLLLEAHTLREAEGRLKLVKARLCSIIREEGMEGVRHGNLCCITRYQAGRRSLDRTLLVENGVTPEQIEASMKIGDPITVVELPEMES